MLLCKEKINIKYCESLLIDDLHMFFDSSFCRAANSENRSIGSKVTKKRAKSGKAWDEKS